MPVNSPSLSKQNNLHKNTARKFFWMSFYNFIIAPSIFFLVSAISFFGKTSRQGQKIKLGISGREHLFENIHSQLKTVFIKGPRVWIHAASMGECEQAKPILRELKKQYPNIICVLTVFSPSAFIHIDRKTIPAEVMCYLPFDKQSDVKRFLNLINPVAGIIIRHDLWPNILWQAQKRKIFLILADASVSTNAHSKRHILLVRQFNSEIFACFNLICAVSESAITNLRQLIRYPERIVITGDTRFDQVLFRTQSNSLDKLLPQSWLQKKNTFIAGSTWPSDDAVIIPAIASVGLERQNFKIILVPHEPTESHLSATEQLLTQYKLSFTRLSQTNGQTQTKVLIVDHVGVLAELYNGGQIAFVGGSFGPGVHSVIEAAAHGLPVLFGPCMRNSIEAREMEKLGIGKVIRNANECTSELVTLLDNPTLRQKRGEECKNYVEQKAGAAKKVVSLLRSEILNNIPMNITQ